MWGVRESRLSWCCLVLLSACLLASCEHEIKLAVSDPGIDLDIKYPELFGDASAPECSGGHEVSPWGCVPDACAVVDSIPPEPHRPRRAARPVWLLPGLGGWECPHARPPPSHPSLGPSPKLNALLPAAPRHRPAPSCVGHLFSTAADTARSAPSPLAPPPPPTARRRG